MSDRSWSLKWNERAVQFFAKYRKVTPLPEEDPWGTKRIPKSIARHQQLDAEQWMVAWYAAYLRSGGLNVEAPKIVSAKKTIKLLESRWLKFRYDDPGTAINTYVGFRRVLRNWILSNDRFEHYAIDHLDMERDFTAEVCLAWIESLRGSPTTRLRYAQAAKQMFKDCIMFGWIDPNMANPFEREIVKRELRRLANEAADDSPTIFFTAEQAVGLLTTVNSKVSDFRRLRYLMALATGQRDHEIQGHIWSDFHLDAPIPYAWVDRQLLKIGPKPFVHMTDLKQRRMSKDEMLAQPSALVGPPKMNSRRPVPLLPIVVAALRHWWRIGWMQHTGFAPRKDDPVFPSSNANRHSPPGQFCFSESPELLRLDLDRLGLPTTFTPEGKSERIDFDFHALRHTFATLLEVGGVDRPMIGALLGHKAADVAGGHYIGEIVEARARHVETLRLPPRIQFVATLIEAEAHAGWHEAKGGAVIPLRRARLGSPRVTAVTSSSHGVGRVKPE